MFGPPTMGVVSILFLNFQNQVNFIVSQLFEDKIDLILKLSNEIDN